jgi:hypothetical protein
VSAPFARKDTVIEPPVPGAPVALTVRPLAAKPEVGASVSTVASVVETSVIPDTAA